MSFSISVKRFRNTVDQIKDSRDSALIKTAYLLAARNCEICSEITPFDLLHNASKLYHQTHDIILVKEKLGHRNYESTMVYTHLLEGQTEEEYYTASATNQKEAAALLEAGWEYILTTPEEVMLFRKRK